MFYLLKIYKNNLLKDSTINLFDSLGNQQETFSITSIKNLIFGYKVLSENRLINLNHTFAGAYTLLNNTEEGLFVENDYLGLEPVFYKENSNSIYISNSFEILVKNEKSTVTFDENQINFYSVNGQLTQQLASDKTIVKDIYFLKSGYDLIVRKEKLEIRKKNLDFLHNRPYQNLILMGSIQASAIVSGIPKNTNKNLITLSGGIDSRAVLACAKYCYGENLNDYFSISTSMAPQHEDDAKIANQVCIHLNAPINSNIDTREWFCLEPDAAIQRWAIGNNGLYFPLHISPNFYQDTRFSLRGGQSNNIVYEDLGTLSKRVNLETGLPIQWTNEFLKDAIVNSQDLNDYEIMYQHYIQYRYRIHYGRPSALRSEWAINVDPLINPFLDCATKYMTKEERDFGKNSFDVMTALEPRLSELPFNSKAQNILDKFKNTSAFYPVGLGSLDRINLKASYLINLSPNRTPNSKGDITTFDNKVSDLVLNEIFSHPPSTFTGLPIFQELRKKLNISSNLAQALSDKESIGKMLLFIRLL
jgi:hypothetical protein